jgi:ketosteroid isomerase-like protein
MKAIIHLRTFLFLIILSIGFSSCDFITPTVKPENKGTPQELIAADIAFSDMSRQVGIKKAFTEFMSQEGILLRPDYPPIVGAEAIDYLSLVSDTGYVLSWKPSGGEIAKSGDMGFTYGEYTLKVEDAVINGTYVNVWKKQRDGAWKYVLNNTNQGTSPDAP